MSEPNDVEKILGAIQLNTDFMLHVAGDKEATERLKAREDLPEQFKALIKDEEPKKPDKKAEPKEGEPKREDYQTPTEFYKAYTEYMTAQKEHVAVSEKAFEERLVKLKDEILDSVKDYKFEGVEMPLGEVIKKSLVPAEPNKPTVVNFTELYEKADSAENFDSFLYEVKKE